MADEAFALSPISARAAQPSEADYQAIREAFMETARGRWFLGEFAKRNRQADTMMVLDAIARIERALETPRQPAYDKRLPEIVWNIVDEAADSAAMELAIDKRLAPIRQGARILKDISLRWREIGSDSRICDQIDAQVDAIQDTCSQLAGMDIRSALADEFDLIRSRIETLAEDYGKAVPQVTDAPLLQLHLSLGAASVEARRSPGTEPISAIRRMSLTEKINFFS